jgi:hypothetical protein
MGAGRESEGPIQPAPRPADSSVTAGAMPRPVDEGRGALPDAKWSLSKAGAATPQEGTPVLTVVQDGSSEEPASGFADRQIVREGARRMLAEALQAEVDAYIAAFAGERDEDGRRLVVRKWPSSAARGADLRRRGGGHRAARYWPSAMARWGSGARWGGLPRCWRGPVLVPQDRQCPGRAAEVGAPGAKALAGIWNAENRPHALAAARAFELPTGEVPEGGAKITSDLDQLPGVLRLSKLSTGCTCGRPTRSSPRSPRSGTGPRCQGPGRGRGPTSQCRSYAGARRQNCGNDSVQWRPATLCPRPG